MKITTPAAPHPAAAVQGAAAAPVPEVDNNIGR